MGVEVSLGAAVVAATAPPPPTIVQAATYVPTVALPSVAGGDQLMVAFRSQEAVLGKEATTLRGADGGVAWSIVPPVSTALVPVALLTTATPRVSGSPASS